MTATGRCLCGAVSFEAEEVSAEVHACHCNMCRRWVGGPNMAAQVGSVTFSGQENIKRFPSSEWADRAFCSECGSNLFYQMKGADNYIMQQGLFDDQTLFSLHGEIYVDEKPPGYSLAGDHPRQTGAEFLKSMGIEVPDSE